MSLYSLSSSRSNPMVPLKRLCLHICNGYIIAILGDERTVRAYVCRSRAQRRPLSLKSNLVYSSIFNHPTDSRQCHCPRIRNSKHSLDVKSRVAFSSAGLLGKSGSEGQYHRCSVIQGRSCVILPEWRRKGSWATRDVEGAATALV
jgi:hypothetical protein